MTGTGERELVMAGMTAAVRDMAPVDVDRLAHVLALPVTAVPVDLAIAQSREVQAGSSAIEASAALIADSADPGFWTRELLSRGDVAPDVVAIAIAVCTRSYPDHPLAMLSAGDIRLSRTIHDLYLIDDGVGSLDLTTAGEGGDHLVLLDRADPLGSWIMMDARAGADQADAATLPFTARASMGRLQNLMVQRAAVTDAHPLYVGAAVAIMSRSGTLPDDQA